MGTDSSNREEILWSILSERDTINPRQYCLCVNTVGYASVGKDFLHSWVWFTLFRNDFSAQFWQFYALKLLESIVGYQILFFYQQNYCFYTYSISIEEQTLLKQ